MRILATALLVVGLGLAAPQAAAEEEAPQISIKDLTLGDYWFGAKISKEDLAGKVVLFEMWGS